jgi:hypothetical protein
MQLVPLHVGLWTDNASELKHFLTSDPAEMMKIVKLNVARLYNKLTMESSWPSRSLKATPGDPTLGPGM